MSTPQQITFDLGHRTAFAREDFLVAPCNQDAVNWVDLWPKWPAPALVLHGPAASGKTHLAAVWAEQCSAKFINTADLINKGADEIAASATHIVLDHIEPWFGDREAETTLFHLYNIFKEEQRSMLLTTRMAPSHAQFSIADIASRLRAAPCVTIQAPDDSLLSAILVKLFADRQLQVGHDLISYIVPRMERSYAAAFALVEKADQLSLREKRSISLPLMRQIFIDMAQSEDSL
jgi:chromosomal replication initiation ATPase DnaA